MKKILIGLFILSSATLFAQDNKDNRDRNQNPNRDDRNNQVPEHVQRSFQQDNPNAQNPQWSNNNGQWHGSYKDQNDRNIDTYYNGNGERIDTHTSYKQEELPTRVRRRANKRYHGNYNTYRIDRPNSQPLFQIQLRTGGTTYMDKRGRETNYDDHH
jgi:hypothetical protein